MQDWLKMNRHYQGKNLGGACFSFVNQQTSVGIRLELIQKQLLESNPAPDKATNQMAWAQHMNMVKA